VGDGNVTIRYDLMNMSIQSAPYGKQATAVGFYQAVYAISMFAGPALAGGGK
jgi:DHA1 family multidrug resistance protein-like MFS transporter